MLGIMTTQVAFVGKRQEALMRTLVGFLKLCLKLLYHDDDSAPRTSDKYLSKYAEDIVTALVNRPLDIFRVAIVNSCVGMVSISALYTHPPVSDRGEYIYTRRT